MNKFDIKNRKGEKVVVIVEGDKNKEGLAFVMHGLGGFMTQPHIEAMAQAFLENDYTVVRFDTTNTFGESDGNYEKATTTNYYEDLEDVIKWAEDQIWYQQPFCLTGHSLGGICIALFAENFPTKVKGLAPISTVVSGQLSQKSPKTNPILEEWQKTGWREEMSSDGKRFKKLPWSHMEDRLKYDLLEKIDKLTMPVLLIVGNQDKHTPVEHQKLLFDQLPGDKEFNVIKDAPHTFRTEQDITEVRNTIKAWINKKLQ